MEYEKSRNKNTRYREDFTDSDITIEEIQKMLDTFAEKENVKKSYRSIQSENVSNSITPEIAARLNNAYEESLSGKKTGILNADVESLMKLAETSEALRQAIISSPEEVMHEFMKFEFRYKLANDSELTKLRYLNKFMKHPVSVVEAQKFFTAACIVFGINLVFMITLPITIPFLPSLMNLFGFGLMYKGYRYRGMLKSGIGNFIKSRFSKRSKSIPSDAKLKEKLDEVGSFMNALRPRDVIRRNDVIYLAAYNYNDQRCFYEVMVNTMGDIQLKKVSSKEVYGI